MPPVKEDRRAIWSWCFFDFANSPFTTLVITFIYSTYFANAMAKDYYLASGAATTEEGAIALGTALWARGVVITSLTVALLSPLMGAIADRGGYRKVFLFSTTVLAAIGSAVLYFIEPSLVMPALVVVVVANIAFEMGMVFYNAFLPDLAPPEKIGRVSGYGWGLGYGGGVLALIVALFTLVQPEVPLFGFSKDAGENIRATNLLVAIWLGIFSIPLFLWVREDKSHASRGLGIVAASYRQLKDTFAEIRKYRQIVRFLLARLIYNDGLVTIFAFGGIYAQGTFGFSFQKILVFGIVLNVTAGLGAVALGFLDDKLGGKTTIQLSTVALAVATLMAVLAPTETLFWIAGVMVGIFSGPNQAASRSLMGRFVPPDKETEFFGFFAFSGKATAFMGPFLLGVLTAWSGSQRLGISVVLFFFIIGFILMTRVDEEEGKAARAG